MQGNDTYEAEYISQGIGIFGTDILYEAQSQDTYCSIGNVQDSSSFSMGLLIDNQGNERSLYRLSFGY